MRRVRCRLFPPPFNHLFFNYLRRLLPLQWGKCRYSAVIIEKPDGIASCIGAQVRISHRHLYVRMPKKLLYGFNGRPSNHEVRRKGMAKNVPLTCPPKTGPC